MAEFNGTVMVGQWATLRDQARPLRLEVFVEEQQVPLELEWDDADDTALHAVAYANDGRAVATGRLLRHAPDVARIGRMAVRKAWRGQGAGAAVLAALTQAAQARGDAELVLHAQVTALGFYQRAGFAPRGPHFMDAGIEHVEMWRSLPSTS
jgi:predicted GNAT family N-acyltransferase